MRLPPGSRWEVRVDIPSVWVRGGEVAVGLANSETELRLLAWPWAKLKGRIKLPLQTGAYPKEVTVVTIAAPALLRKQEAPQGSISCPLDKTGAFTCDLPASTYDLAITVEGLAPAYRQKVKVEATKPTDLGTLALKEGASVAGWVAVDGGTISAEHCVATLRPFSQGSTDPSLRAKLGQARKEARVRDDGFFQITAVAPGTYVLEVEQPGLARALVPKIEVWPGAESFLREPIVLHKPLRLELRLDPALDWLGRPWRVQVFRDGSRTGESGLGALFSGEASADGVVEVPNQAPGSFSIFVDDSKGNRLSWQQSVDIQGPEDALREIHVEYTTVSGDLRLGKEPLAGTIWFGGRYGAPRVEMSADRKGKFLGVLPRGGAWLAAVDSDQPTLSTETWVQVSPDRSGRATVEINLQDTRIFGRVLTDKGGPGQGAEVLVQQGNRPVILKTDGEGLFETRGLQPGLLVISARRQEGEVHWTSSPAYATAVEGQGTGPIELRLRRSKAFSGTLVSDRGPVIGAEIFVGPLQPKTATGGDSARTDLGGSFQAQIDSVTERVLVAVMAPGQALQVFEASATQPATFSISARGGTVILEGQRSGGTGPGSTARSFLFQNHLLLPPAIVTQWMFDHGAKENETVGGWKIPALAPGLYQACRIPLSELATWLAAGAEPGSQHCVEGSLVSGGTLTLKPPEPRNVEGSR